MLLVWLIMKIELSKFLFWHLFEKKKSNFIQFTTLDSYSGTHVPMANSKFIIEWTALSVHWACTELEVNFELSAKMGVKNQLSARGMAHVASKYKKDVLLKESANNGNRLKIQIVTNYFNFLVRKAFPPCFTEQRNSVQ